MFKNLLMFLILGMVAALPATAMAADLDWLGTVDSEFANVDNFRWDPTLEMTYQITLTAGEFINAPLISDASGYLQYGLIRIRNAGTTLTQTGGTMEWMNGTGTTQGGVAVYGGTVADPATLQITGGTMISDDLHVGHRSWFGIDDPVGVGLVNLWGDSTFLIRRNPYYPVGTDVWDLRIGPDSKIDIRDNGVLRVPWAFETIVDDYIAEGKIVAGEAASGYWLYTVMIGEEYIVTATNEVPIPGDADQDRDVDDDDATILASNWLTASGAAWTDGDFNYDGAVNEADASILAANYGITPPAASAPEPGTLLLLCLGLGSLALIRRK
jgi:hypothetical protein